MNSARKHLHINSTVFTWEISFRKHCFFGKTAKNIIINCFACLLKSFRVVFNACFPFSIVCCVLSVRHNDESRNTVRELHQMSV